MSTRENTKLIQAHIPEAQKKDFDKQLIDDDLTQQEALSELVSRYIKGEVKLK